MISIPYAILTNHHLTNLDKLLIGFFLHVHFDNNVFQTNRELGKIFNVSIPHISTCISRLKKENLITIENGNCNKRKIILTEKLTGMFY